MIVVVQVLQKSGRGGGARRAADALSIKCRSLRKFVYVGCSRHSDFSKNRQFDEGGDFEGPLLRRSIHTFTPRTPLSSPSLACIRGRERGRHQAGAHAFSVAHSTHGRSATEIGGPRSLR